MKRFIAVMIVLVSVFMCSENVWAVSDTSTSSVVLDMNSKRILYAKNKDEKRLIASITKIMTSVVAIENKNLDDVVVIGEEVLPMYGSNIYIEVGEKLTLRDLLYGLLLRSGNDAAVAIATFVGGDEKTFVKMMNEKAKQLGMTNTVFNNSHGLDEDTQNYSTAYDMALLSSYANTLMEYCEITGTKKWTVSTSDKTYLWYNRNKLLSLYKYATGGKTGYTPKAGRTLVTSASKNNLNLTVVTLNDNNEYTTHESLYEYAFSKYENVLLIDKNNFTVDDFFFDGEIYVENSFSYPLTKEEKASTKTIVDIYKLEGYEDHEKIGEVSVVLDDVELYKENIYVRLKKEKKEGILSKIIKFFKGLFGL